MNPASLARMCRKKSGQLVPAAWTTRFNPMYSCKQEFMHIDGALLGPEGSLQGDASQQDSKQAAVMHGELLQRVLPVSHQPSECRT